MLKKYKIQPFCASRQMKNLKIPLVTVPPRVRQKSIKKMF
jgi:hypothetical protein